GLPRARLGGVGLWGGVGGGGEAGMGLMVWTRVGAGALSGAALRGGAGVPAGPFQEAGRLVDQLATRLGSFGAELVQQMQQGRGAIGSMGEMMGRMMGDPAERPLISIMLQHRTELGLSADQVSRLETLRSDFT